jgi:hypothetical protein
MSRSANSKTHPVFLLPWRLVAFLFVALCFAGGLAAVSTGLQYVPGAVSGLILGFFGAVFGGRVKTAYAIASVFLASAVTNVIPAWVSFYALAPAFAMLAGTELARFGTRVSVIAIMSWIMLNSPVTFGADLIPLLLVFSASAVAGTAMVVVLKAEARVAPSPVERGYAVAHGCALAVGLVLAQLIASQFNNSNSHWIALLFAARALDPPGSHAAQAGRKGFAMVVGAGVASVLVMLPLSLAWFKLVAVAFFLIGLRYLPSGRSVSPALLSAGIVLASSPTTETALFRAEAATVACGLVLFVFFLARWVRQLILELRGH